MKLKDRVAIITGGSSGIGRGIALEFAREVARVCIADIQEEPKRGKYHEQETVTPTVEEVEKLGGEGHFIETDIGQEESVQSMVDESVNLFGKIDILVNNAGIYKVGDGPSDCLSGVR